MCVKLYSWFTFSSRKMFTIQAKWKEANRKAVQFPFEKKTRNVNFDRMDSALINHLQIQGAVTYVGTFCIHLSYRKSNSMRKPHGRI